MMGMLHRWCLTGLALAAGASVSKASEWERTLERVEIIGSHIRRSPQSTLLPVEIHRRRDIEATGASTLSEWMRAIPSLDIRDVGELTGDSPGLSGTAHVRLRGLDEASVLVLLNGRRLPLNALHDASGAGAAVDLNAMPLLAVERIEILKDGASALYGADAVAGVVNIVTRRDWHGLQIHAESGRASQSGGAESHASVILGGGDVQSEGFHVLGALDFFRRAPILRSERDISSTADFRRFGGPDARSSFSPSGNIVDADFAMTGRTVRPCPDSLFNERCRFDFNADVLTAYNGAERVGGLLVAGLALPGQMRLESDLLFSAARNHFDSHPVLDVFMTPAGDTYYGRFMQGGPRQTRRSSSMQHLSLALKGLAEGLDWTLEAGEGRSRVRNEDRNYFDRAGWLSALESGALDPTSTDNDERLIESLRVRPLRSGVSTLRFVNAKVSGPWPTPKWLASSGGPGMLFSAGASWWHEGISDTPDLLTQRGDVVGGIQQSAVNAGRSAAALYGELVMPWSPVFETQVALRHDRFAAVSSTSPKFAWRYAVSPAIGVSGSVTRSFRMPALKQLYGAREEGAADFTSDALCTAQGLPAGCVLSGFEVYGSNPTLKPERGLSSTLGMVWEPAPDLRATLGWWQVKLRDAITTPTIDQSVVAGLYERDTAGRLTVATRLANFSAIRNEGVDLDLRWKGARQAGYRWTVSSTSTHYLRQEKRRDAGGAWQEFNGTYSRPKWRHVLALGMESAGWESRLSLRTTGGYLDTDEPEQAALSPKVRAHSEVDIQCRWFASRQLTVDVGVKNLADRMPPFSAQNAISNQYSQLGFAELYSARGRFVHAGLTYNFD